MGFDFGARGKLGLNARDGRVHVLERLEHVDVPVEEEVDLRGAAAGNRLHV